MRAPLLPRTAPLVTLAVAACASLRGGGPPLPVEVRNSLDTAFNLYVLPNKRGERFVGQVGPGKTRTVRLRLARGDTVRLRALPVTGGQEHVQYPVVLDSGTVWRIP